MNFIEHLSKSRESISARWLKALIESYPQESGKFLFSKKNEFTNPIGHAYEKGLADIFAAVFNRKTDDLQQAMQEIVKIRSIQDYSASFAMNFMFILKDVIKEEYESYSKNKGDWKEYAEAIAMADEALKTALDMLLIQRERIYEIKANEVKKRTSKMIERLNKKYDYLDEKTDDFTKEDRN